MARTVLPQYLLLGVLTALMSSASAQSRVMNGFVAYHPFNGNANDTSGNGNNGVPQYLLTSP